MNAESRHDAGTQGVLAAVLLQTLIVCCCGAGEAETQAEAEAALGEEPVLVVGEAPITLRELENELLRREGRNRLLDILERQLDHLDWATVADDDLVLGIGERRIPRDELVADLMPAHSEDTASAMLAMAVVRGALERAGLHIDQSALDAELERHRRSLRRKLAERNGPHIRLEDVVRSQHGSDLASWMEEDSFRLAAGLHHYVHARAEIPRSALQAHFAEYREQRFTEREAVRLHVIHIPYRSDNDADAEPVDESRRETLRMVMRRLRQDIASGRMDFAQTWSLYGKAYDSGSTDGDAGWIARDGSSEHIGARRIPEVVMQAAFAAATERELPALLPPIAHDDGMDLIRVDAYRPRSEPTFDEIRDEVRRDYIEQHLDRLTKTTMASLMARSEIERGARSVTVDGLRISRRQVENHILDEHGVDAILNRAESLLQNLSLQALGDEAMLLRAPGLRVPRIALVAELLQEHGAQVRGDLLRIAALRQALAQAGIELGPELVERELARMRDSWRAEGAEAGDFRSYVRRHYGRELEAWRAEEGFRLAAGLHELALRRSEVDDERLRDHLRQHPGRFGQQEAIRARIIHFPLAEEGEVAEADQLATARELVDRLHREIAAGKLDFAEAWRRWGRQIDPEAEDGLVGWIGRGGESSERGVRPWPQAVSDAAFAADLGNGPRLLEPIVHGGGLALVEVLERRAGSGQSFEELRDSVRRDYIERHIERYQAELAEELLAEVPIEYRSLFPLIQRRMRQAQTVMRPSDAVGQ